jgi:hypothetical protein
MIVVAGLVLAASMASASSLSVESTAALYGSVAQPGVTCSGDGQPGPCGLEVTVDNVDDAYVQSDHPNVESTFNVTFRLRNATLAGAGTAYTIIGVLARDVGPSPGHVYIFIKRNQDNTQWKMVVRARMDNGQTIRIANFRIFDGVGAPDGSQEFRIVWAQATGPDAEDGIMEVWKNGVRKDVGFPGAPFYTGETDLRDLDNYTYNVDWVRFGSLFHDQTFLTGTYHFDEYTSTR